MFGYSRQVYYRMQKSQDRRKRVAAKVVQLVQQQRCLLPKLGGKKLYYLLRPELKDLGVGRDKLFSILRANHLLIKPRRSYHTTTNSHHRFRKHKDKAAGMKLKRPEQLWVADITYVGNSANPMYLSLVTDAYSKKIVGHDVSQSLAASGSIKALQCAVRTRQYPQQDLVHHSDRGIQYCCDDYQKALNKSTIKCSMTETYDPYANAVAERVNGILKQEFLGKQNKHLPISQMKKLVANSIKIYNSVRPHYSCYYNTPNQMHRQSEIEIRSYKKITSARPRPS